MRTKRRWYLLLTALPAVSLAAAPAQSQIATDGSVGPGAVTLTGPDFSIPASLGELRGSNLFHSFRDFNIGPEQSATFTGPGSVRNVISRVTGGDPSRIDGVLRSTVGQADFYFINPAGILFGPGAEVNIPGALHVAAAHDVRFADGATFSADLARGSTLTTAPPTAFGFLDRPAGPVEINQSVLSLEHGRTATLAGGSVTVTGEPNRKTKSAAGTIMTAGGTVQIAAFSTAGTVNLNAGTAAGGSAGPIRLSDGAKLLTQGDGGGTIKIRGGNLVIENSIAYADNTGDRPAAGGIDVRLTGGLTASGGEFRSRAFGKGSAGSITVEAGDMTLTRQSFLDTTSFGGGESGTISVTGQSLRLAGRSVVSTETFGTAKAGDLRIGVGYLSANNSFIGAGSSGTAETADAGLVEISAGTVEFRNEGRIFNGTTGWGDGGDVKITADLLLADGRLDHINRNHTGIASTVEENAKGNGGDIVVAAQDIFLLNEGKITVASRSSGSAGNISIDAGTITLAAEGQITAGTEAAGPAGEIRIGTGNLTMLQGRIQSESSGSGPGGQIRLTAGTADLLGRSVLSAEALGTAPGGSIAIDADNLKIDNSFVGTSTSGSTEEADAGSVTVNGGALTLLNEGRIFNGTNGPGDGGDITVRVESLFADGTLDHVNDFTTGVGSSVERGGRGKGGNVDIEAGTVTLSNEGRIFADTKDAGPAGNIRIAAGSLTMPDRGLVLSTSFGEGVGGRIAVTADKAELAGKSVLSAEALGTGPGGSITIGAGYLLANNSFIGASSGGRSETADAGTVTVDAGTIDLRNEGRIFNGTSGPGDGGDISIVADRLLADGTLDHVNEFKTGVASTVEVGGRGTGGDIAIRSREITLLNQGDIAAGTKDAGDAGTVEATASTLMVSGGEVTADTSGSGDGGSIRITADRIDVVGGGMLFAGTGGPAKGGDVEVNTGILSVTGNGDIENATPDRTDNPTGLFSNVTNTGSGPGGTVTVTAGEIFLSRGGAISAQTAGSGPAGSVTVRAERTLNLEGGIIETAVADPLDGTPERASERTRGGNLSVSAGNILLSEGAALAARSIRGPGQAGTISVMSRGDLRSRDSTVTTQAIQGDGGDILLRAGYLLDLENSAITTLVESGIGNGGNITIEPPLMVLDRSSIVANARGGNGGNINIRAGQLISTPDSTIQASSQLGIDGDIVIDAPQNDIGGALAVLPGSFLDGAALLAETCAARGGKPASSMVAGGRGGLPPDPEQPLSLGRPLDLPAAASMTQRTNRTGGGIVLGGLAAQPPRPWLADCPD